MTSHRWRIRRNGSDLIIDADEADGFSDADVDALIASVEADVANDRVSRVILDGVSVSTDKPSAKLMQIIRRLGAMVTRYRKAFTMHL